ncbi:MAG: tRNA pseudouridine(13) synthase TruD, partial [Immundisolibacteraceae bacterium]|nr:tRNA pseudouridine(13) synthase TruD [Immundisolibacteraceae bacterium]
MRQQPEDFQVTELIELDLSGLGEHLWVRVRKQGLTTQELAGELARWAKVRPNAVGYSGMKDKYAVTEQWFSITLPGRDDPEPPTAPKWQITQQSRHSKKLKRGFHTGNHFQIRLRDADGLPEQVEQRLQQLKQQGCPNYFGDQRFGRDGDNVESALAMFNGSRRVKQRHLKGVLISAARSHVFNQLL